MDQVRIGPQRTGARAIRRHGDLKPLGRMASSLATCAFAVACSGDDRPGSLGAAGTYGSLYASGGTSAGGTDNAGNGANAGASPGGAGGSGTPSSCGDGKLQAPEACDGSDLAGASCAQLGFTDGEVTCGENCQFDTSNCSGKEACHDGRDNDGDRAIDCEDTDCSDVCQDACLAPPTLPDPAQIIGSTSGRGANLDPTCGLVGVPSGSETAYEFIPMQSGMLEANLTADFPILLSIRTGCDQLVSEIACTARSYLRIPIEELSPVYLTIEGMESGAEGNFELDVRSYPVTCGDARRDASERCDDGNTVAGDGCDEHCVVESSESEANGSLELADAFMNPYYGEVSGEGDEDLVSFEIHESPASVHLAIVDFGDGACALEELDPFVELLDAQGDVLASDDDSGEGYCARLSARGLTTGTYFIRVSAASMGASGGFPYVLQSDLDVCGNNRHSPAEQCDDGNLTADDGCSPTCELP